MKTEEMELQKQLSKSFWYEEPWSIEAEKLGECRCIKTLIMVIGYRSMACKRHFDPNIKLSRGMKSTTGKQTKVKQQTEILPLQLIPLVIFLFELPNE